jgi:phage shock protein PspC (stress-responsive transcriptional regulator)
MNTVIIVNLNGIAFHLEEPGFQTLRAYLDRAQSQLAANPDKSEIMSDLEQAIADKSAHFLNPHKNVLTAAEIDDVVRQMGPVQSEGGAAPSDTTPSNGPAQGDAAPHSASGQQANAGAGLHTGASPGFGAGASVGPSIRRLYQIRGGAMISGVCTGIAAYLDIDVTVVRILFVLFTILTYGLGLTVYILMMLVVPFANTDEEHAAASGAPFNAQQVIDRAKKHYAEFKDGKEWRRHWSQQRREWRRKWRTERIWWGHNFQRNVYAFRNGTGYAGHLFAGLMIPILAITTTLLDCAAIVAIVLLASTGNLLGWQLPADIPLWAAVLVIILICGAITSPLRHARKAIFYYNSGPDSHWMTASYQLLSLAVFVIVCWVAYTRVPEVRDFFSHFFVNWQMMMNNIIQSIHHSAPHAPAGTGTIAPPI